jgi:uncharacterized protein (TIGR02996 family)
MSNPALLAEVLAHPADDAPRLAYAKWLKANGQADRAEFIKVQCDRAAKDRFDPARERLEKKEKSLLKKNEAKWLAELPEWARKGGPRFRRGFVGIVRCALDAFVTGADELVRVTPVDGIELSSGGADAKSVKALAKCPHAARLSELALWYNDVGDSGAKAIAASSFFAGLKTLRLGNVGLTDASAVALAASPHLVGLTELNLGGNEFTAAGIRALASTAWKLDLLALDNMDLSGKAMTALAAWPGLALVRSLALQSTQIGPAEVRALVSSPHLTNLRELELGSNPLTAEGVAALADAPALDHLRALQLSASHLKDDAVPAILRFARLKELTSFWAVNNDFSDEGRREVMQQFAPFGRA